MTNRLLLSMLILVDCSACNNTNGPVPVAQPPTAVTVAQPTPAPAGQQVPTVIPVAVQPRYSIPPLHEFKRHRRSVGAVVPAFAPNGRLIATACAREGEIAIWNWPAGTLNCVVARPHTIAIRFSNDSRLLAFGTMDWKYGVLQVVDGKSVARHDDSHFDYYDVAWSADDEAVFGLAVYGAENEVHRLSLRTGESKVIVPKLEKADAHLNATNQASLMITEWGGKIALFQLETKAEKPIPQQTFSAPSTAGIPFDVSLNRDGSLFAFSESQSKRVDVYTTSNSERVGGFSVSEDQMGRFQFIPGSDSKMIVYSMNNTWDYNSIAVRDITQPRKISRLEVHAPTSVSGVSLSQDGKLVAVAFYDGLVAVWEVAAIEKEGK